MFWSTTTFEMASEEDMRYFPLRSLLAQEHDNSIPENVLESSSRYYDAKSNMKDLELERWESIDGIHQLFDEHDETRKVFREAVGQIVQIARLTPKKAAGSASIPENIVVANTHLFYHPMADHIRVLQAYAVCHKVDEIRRKGARPDPVIIAGDFNSGPLSGAVRLLTHRSVLPYENDCWKHLNVYRWECGGNECKPACFLSINRRMQSSNAVSLLILADMIDHGYIGNYISPDGEIVEPCYVDEEFVDAHSDEAFFNDSTSTLNESTMSATSDEASSTIHPPAIELPSSFPQLSSGCLKVPRVREECLLELSVSSRQALTNHLLAPLPLITVHELCG